MKKLVIYSTHVFNFENNDFHIGGVQTYMRDLSLLGLQLGAQSIIYDVRDSAYDIRTTAYKGVAIKEFPKGGSFQNSFDKVYNIENGTDVVFVIATDQYLIKSEKNNVIQIQHGIAFDFPGYYIGGLWNNRILSKVNKLIRCLRNVKRLNQTRTTVCVDYNYFNWYRTLGTECNGQQMHVIPNYASQFLSEDELFKKMSQRQHRKKIVFARRFEDYRGAIIFANVASRLLRERDDVEVTFAGDGHCIDEMKQIMKGCDNCHFTSYSSSETLEFHKAYDVAVVPTIFSEGTSLSLIEAMAAGCLPVASHVGGMTNIILDSYNGFLIYPSEDSLYKTMCSVLDLKKDEFDFLAINAHKTALHSFSINKWKKSWIDVLNKL